jgi:hypothetical protein
MRSGSTLLSHIIGSHPQFAYAGETYQRYESAADWPKLVTEACQRLHKLRLNSAYIVGQINHGIVSDEALKSPSLYKCVILIRSPEATLKSRMSIPYAPGMPAMSEKDALENYMQRLGELAEYGRILRKRALFVEYDDLQDRAAETLKALTGFFSVTRPFESHYKTHRMTGGHGDPSENIRVGRIIRTKPHDITLSAYSIAQASAAYQSCRKKMLSNGVQFAHELP